jgi:hypothetical protein
MVRAFRQRDGVGLGRAVLVRDGRIHRVDFLHVVDMYLLVVVWFKCGNVPPE